MYMKKINDVKEFIKNKKVDIFKIVGIVLGIVALFVLVFFASMGRDSNQLKHFVSEIGVNEYFDLKSGDDLSVIVFVKNGCGWCTQYKPVIRKVSADYELPIYTINASKFVEDEYTTIVNDSPYMTSKGGLATPLTLVVSGGEEVAYLSGAVEYSELENFLVSNGVIE